MNRAVIDPGVRPAVADAEPGPGAPLANDRLQRLALGVFRFVRALGAPPLLADDLTQDAFAIAWRKGKQHLPEAALGAFLRRTARLRWLETRREDVRAERAITAAAERLWQRECAHDDGDARVATLRACLATLTERARTAVERTFRDEEDRASVAAALRLTPNGLKTLLQRARQVLAECLRRNQS